jgi:hypothetical protein
MEDISISLRTTNKSKHKQHSRDQRLGLMSRRNTNPCDTCSDLNGCHICGKCLQKHCLCGRRYSRTLCQESQACNCPTLLRCPLCRGCMVATPVRHCNCEAHAKQLCLCGVIKDERDSDDEELQHKIISLQRLYGLPSCRSQYDAGRRDLFESADLYKLILKDKKVPQLTAADGIQGHDCSTYLASLEKDPVTSSSTHFVRRKLVKYFDRSLENVEYELTQEASLPSENLVDYIVYVASLKCTHVSITHEFPIFCIRQ